MKHGDMHNKFETIGIVNWYDKEKGYGVLKNIHDNREYFIHQSKLRGQYKIILEEGDIVMFAPDYDQKRNREIAINIRYFNNTPDLKWAITTWLEEEYITGNHIEKIFTNYLKLFSKDNSIKFEDAYSRLLDVILSFIEKESEVKRLYYILKKAIATTFTKQKSEQLSEKSDLTMMEKMPSNLYPILIELSKSSYVCFHIAYKALENAKESLEKAKYIDKAPDKLFDELIRFVKDVNDPLVTNALSKDKSLIANENYWKGIKGSSIIFEINRYVFTSVDIAELKKLVKQGYIHQIDYAFFKESRPDCYHNLKIYVYKEGVVDNIDITFIKENINFFSASDIIKMRQHYNLTNEVSSEIFLKLTKSLLYSKKENFFSEILLLNQDIQDIHKWIVENHTYLAEGTEEDYQRLLLHLYKNAQINNLDEAFVLYNIEYFSIEDIIKLLSSKEVSITQKKNILFALFNRTLESSSEDRFTNLKTICNHANVLLNEDYGPWLLNICSSANEDNKFFLWKNCISEIYPSSYIRKNLLTSEEKGYVEFYNLFQRQLITLVTASDELWDVLNENQEIVNRPTFYKILYCIKYLVKINNSYKEAIEQKENNYYALILWFLSYSDKFNFELLCRLFIYFLPEDQVRIIKRLFYMAEEKQIRLDVKMLDRLLRIDADLYRLISEQNPEIPIDVSSEIVIKSLVHLSETGFFSADKDVLNIIIQTGRYYKNEKFKIGCYFDDCKGRIIYQWDGYKRENGCIKQSNNFFCVQIYPYVEVSTYSRGWGYHDKTVHNSSFDDIVDAVKNIKGRRWNSTNLFWEIPIEERDAVYDLAKKYSLSIEGSKNPHMNIFKEENDGKPARVNFCEGRPAQKQDEYVGKVFLWCRNGKCFNECVIEHTKENWQNYTMLDFCRILDLEVDSKDSEGRTVRYGKYLSFASIINRANSILEHLYCKECGEMLEPVDTSNYHAHLVTHFHCTNPLCIKHHENIYISKCFNWKCNGVIDDRDTKKCPNGWNICPECGSCCSNRIAQQRIDNCNEIGIRPSPYFIDFINRKLGHLEKREFYCWKCSGLMNHIGDSIYECSICGVRYERKKYDYEPRYSTVSS
jgi:cold shock CspA family protein